MGADNFASDANTQIVAADAIPDGWMGLDNGPATTAEQKEALSTCKTVIMNGPMGVFEMKAFEKGTFGIVDILADLTKEKGAVTIIGGGDSVAATEQSGRAGDMSHISTGGGASLELLEGKVLPGVAALEEKQMAARRERGAMEDNGVLSTLTGIASVIFVLPSLARVFSP